MKKVLKRIVLSAATFLLSCGLCFAQAVDSFADTTTSASSYTQLYTAILRAGANSTTTINITADLTAGTLPLTVAINRTIIINGNNHTLKRNTSYSNALLAVGASSTVTINNLKFTGGSTGWSATLDKSGDFPTVKLTGSVNNKTTVTRPITNLGTLKINNSSFQNFATEASGGVIHNGSDSTSSARLSITNTTFARNYSSQNGAVIYAQHGYVTISGSEFVGNYAKNGGAIYAEQCGGLTISGSTFENNYAADGDGGVVYHNASRDGRTLSINNSHFYDNLASGNGGAVATDAASSEIADSEFLENGAAASGGAIYDSSTTVASKKEISNDVFSGNYAKLDGGAISVNQAAVTDATVASNTSLRYGGGIYSVGNSTVSGGNIVNNSALQRGGGLYMGSGATITNTVVKNNSATDAGGIYLNGRASNANVALEAVEITNNRATGEQDPLTNGLGGGILAERSAYDWQLSIDDTTQIKDNEAANGGADVMLLDSRGELNTLTALPPTVDDLIWYVDNEGARYGEPDYQAAEEDLESQAYMHSGERYQQALGLKLAPVRPEYHIIEGADQSVEIGSDTMTPVRADGELAKFVELQIDNEVVDEENYELASGSTIIKLAPAYLNTLAEGEHTMTFVYTDGSVSTIFTLTLATSGTPAESLPINPETLDHIMLAGISLSMVTAVAFLLRRYGLRRR